MLQQYQHSGSADRTVFSVCDVAAASGVDEIVQRGRSRLSNEESTMPDRVESARQETDLTFKATH